MSPTRIEALNTDERFPRVSGDEPWSETVLSVDPLFSPRERG